MCGPLNSPTRKNTPLFFLLPLPLSLSSTSLCPTPFPAFPLLFSFLSSLSLPASPLLLFFLSSLYPGLPLLMATAGGGGRQLWRATPPLPLPSAPLPASAVGRKGGGGSGVGDRSGQRIRCLGDRRWWERVADPASGRPSATGAGGGGNGIRVRVLVSIFFFFCFDFLFSRAGGLSAIFAFADPSFQMGETTARENEFWLNEKNCYCSSGLHVLIANL